nr:hypothetical protein [Synechococcus sp. PCC 7336]
MKEGATGVSHTNATFGAGKKLCVQTAFKTANLLTQDRLRDVWPFGCSPEMQLFGYGNKIAELAKIHDCLIVLGY